MIERPGLCEECEALWREFAYATAKFARLSLEQQAGGESLLELERQINKAACDRESVRRQIAEHNALEHAGLEEAFQE